MTEIIINDVDISECKFFVKEQLEDFDVYIKNACGINGTECCLVPECYYKQLKRLETENAKLKEKYQEELTVNTQLQEWQDEDLRQIAELKRELEQANECNKTLWKKLEKIKEFVTPLRCNNPLDCWMNKDEGTGDIYGCEGDDYKGCPNGFASCILKIIEGAEDERNRM